MQIKQFKLVLKAAVKAAKAQPMRSGLSALGVVAGVTALIIMVSIGQGAKEEAVAQVAKMGASNLILKRSNTDQKTAQEGLSIADVIEASLTSANVVSVHWAYQARHPVRLSSESTAAVYGHSISQDSKLPQTYQGRYFSEHDYLQRNLVAVVSYSLYRKYPQASQLGSVINIQGESYTVVGVLAPGSTLEVIPDPAELSVYVPYMSLPEFAGAANNRSLIDSAVISFASTADALHAGAAVSNFLNRLPYSSPPELVVPYQLIAQVEETQQRFTAMIVMIASLTLLVGGIGIANVSMATVSERRSEIGVRRACGASRQDILVQFVSESMVLSTAGGACGVVFGIIGTLALLWLGDTPVALPLWVIPASILMALIVGVGAAAYPAKKASMTDPIHALKGL